MILLLLILFGSFFGGDAAKASDYSQLPSLGDAPSSTQTQSVERIEAKNRLTDRDLDGMVKTYKANEMRFNRDYEGKSFSAVMPFRSATETFAKGEYMVGFGVGNFINDVECTTSSPDDISRISDWNPGDSVAVSGTIKTVSMGAVELDSCVMTKR